MRVLIVEQDAYQGEMLTDLLQQRGHEVTLHTQVGAVKLKELKKAPPHVLLLASDLGGASGLELLKKLRNGGLACPAVLMSDERLPGGATKGLHVARQLQKPFPLLNVPGMLTEIVGNEEGQASRSVDGTTIADHPATRPDGDAIQKLARAWSFKTTGVLRVRSERDWAFLVDGDCEGPRALELAILGLYKGDVSTTDMEHVAADRLYPLGPEVLRAAKKLANPSEIMAALSLALIDGPAWERMLELQLSPELRTLLEAGRPQDKSLGELLMKQKADAMALAPEISALVRMGCLSLVSVRRATNERSPAHYSRSAGARSVPVREAPRRAPPKPGRTTTTTTTTTTTRPSGPRQKPPYPPRELRAMRRRLRREAETMETFDAWTILGVPRHASKEDAQRAIERVRPRYKLKAGAPEDVVRLADEVLAKIEAAFVEIMEAPDEVPEETAFSFGEPESVQSTSSGREEEAFAAGKVALAKGDAANAARAFRVARDERLDSARNLAWLGWAIYQDTKRPKETRVQEALAELQLADSFDSTDPDVQYFLAQVEAAAGMARSALARVRRQNRRKPDPRFLALLPRLADAAEAEELADRVGADEPEAEAEAEAEDEEVSESVSIEFEIDDDSELETIYDEDEEEEEEVDDDESSDFDLGLDDELLDPADSRSASQSRSRSSQLWRKPGQKQEETKGLLEAVKSAKAKAEADELPPVAPPEPPAVEEEEVEDDDSSL